MYINVQNLSLRREITWAWHHFYLEYKLKIALLFKPAGGFQSHICRFKIEMLFNLSAIKKEKKRPTTFITLESSSCVDFDEKILFIIG